MTKTFADLPAIGLGEVLALADLQTRRDRKYLLQPDATDAVLDGIGARALEIDGRRSFRYESVYFDTQTWDSYLGAARSRPRRFKVRTRTYLDSEECVLEVKIRDRRGYTVKLRHPYDVHVSNRLTGDGTDFVARVAAVAPHAHRLRAVLTVRYERTTLVLNDGSVRVTIDDDTTWSADGTGSATLRGITLVETKSPGPPSTLDRALWRAGHRPVSISKYCTGMSLMKPDLPANKWHRVLHRHFISNLADCSGGPVHEERTLQAAESRLAARFVPDVSTETVRNNLVEAYAELSDKSTVTTYLVVLAERLAGQRLVELGTSDITSDAPGTVEAHLPAPASIDPRPE